MNNDYLKPFFATAGLISLLAFGFVMFRTYQDSTSVKVDTDKAIIKTLSSFTVKDNPNAESDYERLNDYIPKTDKGEAFKVEKVTQKLNELRAFGTK